MGGSSPPTCVSHLRQQARQKAKAEATVAKKRERPVPGPALHWELRALALGDERIKATIGRLALAAEKAVDTLTRAAGTVAGARAVLELLAPINEAGMAREMATWLADDGSGCPECDHCRARAEGQQ